MATYYVIRHGWNAANQSSMGRSRNPKDTFESGLDCLVAIIEADSEESAIANCGVTVYNNQHLRATTNPRSEKGLTREIREFAARQQA